ncbi:NADH dehydrogenase [ubiquinone] 1 beta subcomplex subunit 8, mitochondrial [Nylanderia fulva]|uniref:NADH dehydrogenase [ubiquinone] 1 beta subcomplex subunit 8, mitochondrial n=1 Tax=Nylanderia fulva TaxID=613905 RepID=UPI0010FB035B|nr:NADH dehydrogenase [ubiquinone] 1 beta subcomplex subunit 8, mitochondrial [Nylanderia fulva]XP_029162803.1 NADH dehydrogenase [ubiquinone] 1 beta subcomplex subunit 8, mitochondrial [Nylanderia fulva]
MALTSKLCGLSSQLFRNRVFLNTARCYSERPKEWSILYQPGEYSQKDHDKIASKYNLHPKDYKPSHPEEAVGDYPELPMIGPAAKDPYYPYDIPTYRKNYKETLNHRFEIMGEDRFSYGYKYRIDLRVASAIFLTTMTVLMGLAYLCEPYAVFSPMMEKQYPEKGKVHYTFEPAK